MRWPWVSRRAYDLLREQVEVYRVQMERSEERAKTAMDTLIRMKRLEAGVSETPREKRKDRPVPPPEFEAYVRKFSSPHLRSQIRSQAMKRVLAGTETWEQIMAEVNGGESGRESGGA